MEKCQHETTMWDSLYITEVLYNSFLFIFPYFKKTKCTISKYMDFSDESYKSGNIEKKNFKTIYERVSGG